MANEYIYLRVNMQHRTIDDVFMKDREHGLAMDRPTDSAMEYFTKTGGELAADEEIFAMVNTEWTHDFVKSKLRVN